MDELPFFATPGIVQLEHPDFPGADIALETESPDC
jgi:hypothetical protein